ncbi:MAG TPA: DUF642 domain-containing protein [Phycisphaerae bacterium]|nr:DUF642 domain-containing protein [Phycisphaerae bacterium]
MKNSVLELMVVLSIVFTVASQVQANLVVNGSFEDPVVPTEEWPPDPLVPSDEYPSLPGWTIVSGNFNLCGINSWASAVGNQNLDLAGNTNGSLMQNITTVVGQEYTLSFYYSDNPYMSVAGVASVTVMDNSSEVLLVDETVTGPGNNSPTDMEWKQFSINFIATSTSISLTFTSLSNPDLNEASPTLDGVVLEAVPEPVTLALLAGGGVLIFAVKRRRR